MLAGKRAKRVGDLILKEMADLLEQKVKDPRVHGVTLTGLRLSNDLKNAKVYFSIIGDRDVVIRAQSGLDSAKGYIKREVGSRVQLRYFPKITFEHDPTLETGNRMEALLKKIRTDL